MKILESYKKMAKQLLIEQPVKFKDKEGNDHEIDMDTAKQYKVDIDGGDSSDYKKAAVKAAGLDKDDSDAKGGDAPEKEPAGKLGSGDFERGSDDGDSEQDALAKDKEWQKKAAASYGFGSKDQSDDDDSTGGDPDDSWDDEEGKPKPSGDKTKKTGFVSKNKPQKAKDLANDPSVDTGPDSRGTEWDASYYGADDSSEWQDDYEEAEEDGDDEKLAQIQWFGEKQGWGGHGDKLGKQEPIPAKDLANDPSADTGPDSRGTDWDASYYGADDSAEWEDQYRDAEEDGDEEELAQIKWFGEKQGWGKDGELPSTSARTGKELGKNETLMINGKKYRRVQEQKGTSKKYSLRETYERIGGK
jgi:hypothetical protein